MRAAAASVRTGGVDASRPLREGLGDVTYALDACTEEAVEGWLLETARELPLSLLTEDTGWRHLGPPTGVGEAAVELAGFDHGGPRIALDPVDGTRGLMHDLRSAWTVVSCAGPGAGIPRLSELELGMVSELPDGRAGRFRRLVATGSGPCELELRAVGGGERLETRVLRADADDRPDHGFFPFFRYEPAQRPTLAVVEARFFARLAEHEGAELRHVFDDQYISNAGQLVLTALGSYRMIADLRALLARRSGTRTTTSKPYDLAGAVLCARRAGCVVTDGEGVELDFELDCTTPVDFVAWANPGTQRRLAPHLRAALSAPTP